MVTKAARKQQVRCPASADACLFMQRVSKAPILALERRNMQSNLWTSPTRQWQLAVSSGAQSPYKSGAHVGGRETYVPVISSRNCLFLMKQLTQRH